MRKRIFEIIEVADDNDKLSAVYDVFMLITIVCSIIPLTMPNRTSVIFDWIDKVTVVIFIIDYILRLITADLKLKKKAASFILYPLTPMAIIDLVSILPSLVTLNAGFKVLKVFRLFRTFKVFKAVKVFKSFRYAKSLQLFKNVIVAQKDALLTILGVAIIYILVMALILLQIEPDTFNNSYFTATYFVTITTSTIGYGDISCVTKAGQLLTMLISFSGIALIALPGAVLISGFQDEVEKKNSK